MTPAKQYGVFDIQSIISEIGSYCQLKDANERYISGAIWSADIQLLQQWQDEITDFRDMMEVMPIPSVPSIYSIDKTIKMIELSGAPFPQERMIDLFYLLTTIAKWAKLEIDEKFNFSTIQPYVHSILPMPELLKSIRQIIGDNGEILDTASPQLLTSRKSLQKATQNLQRVADKSLQKYAAYLQENQTSIRNGRIVLAVVDSHFRKINGIVHGRSATGMTVYVEPRELVEANNEIDNWKNRERQEIYRILVSFADLVRRQRVDILQNWQALCYLDAVSAKVKWLKEKGANPVQFNAAGFLSLEAAVHPALADRIGFKNVVPLTIKIDPKSRWILITGPNAGGKTVALKTVAVNIILAHLGMPVLASEESRVPVLSKILFDIGDKQSIEDDLSTFSAHVKAMRHIAEEADKHALVLIDELGTGTDPSEGAAIAQAFLERLLASGCLGIANSHHGILKLFAHDSDGINNASMEFSESELKPTYHLRMNVPGSSYALEISNRIRLQTDILDRAFDLLGDENRGSEKLILNLQKRLARADRLVADLEKEKSRYGALKKLYQQELEKLKFQKDTLQEEAKKEARKIIENANKFIEKTVKDIREENASPVIIKKARQNVRKIKADLFVHEKIQPGAKLTTVDIAVGDVLRWLKMDQVGEVVEIMDKKNVLLMVGNGKIKTPLAECERIQTGQKKKNTQHSSGYTMPKTGLEIDLRGKFSDEIEYELDRYVGDAIANGWHRISIIHGKGGGVLKKAVTLYLKKHKEIKKFRDGTAAEGGAGVTVAFLK